MSALKLLREVLDPLTHMFADLQISKLKPVLNDVFVEE